MYIKQKSGHIRCILDVCLNWFLRIRSAVELIDYISAVGLIDNLCNKWKGFLFFEMGYHYTIALD